MAGRMVPSRAPKGAKRLVQHGVDVADEVTSEAAWEADEAEDQRRPSKSPAHLASRAMRQLKGCSRTRHKGDEHNEVIDHYEPEDDLMESTYKQDEGVHGCAHGGESAGGIH